MALIDADQEGLVSYLRGSARSVVKVLLASFLKHQGKEKEFLAADRGLNKSKRAIRLAFGVGPNHHIEISE